MNLLNTASFIKKQIITPKFVLFYFTSSIKLKDTFKNGQYISIKVDEYARRSYSILEIDNKRFSILVDITPQGLGCNFLSNLKSGEQVEFLGPLGHFYLPQKLTKNIVFISVGSGIAPLDAMLTELITTRKYLEHNIYFYFGTSYKENILFKNKYSNLLYDGKLKDYKISLTRDKKESDLVVSDRTNTFIKSYAEDIKNTMLFLCGNANFIDSLETEALTKGISPENIFYEKFY